MTEQENTRPVFGAVETTDEDAALDWLKVPRSEMFRRVIVAVDSARSEAMELGDTWFVRHCEDVLFPFLEQELEEAEAKEA
jgi:hypothetical protein